MNTVSIYQYEANNREPGIGNRESGTGNRELSPCSLFGHVIQMFSKVQIGNKEPVPGSFLTIIWLILVSGFVYFISM